jgi:hypothetical protein
MMMTVTTPYDKLPTDAQKLFAEVVEHWRDERVPMRCRVSDSLVLGIVGYVYVQSRR